MFNNTGNVTYTSRLLKLIFIGTIIFIIIMIFWCIISTQIEEMQCNEKITMDTNDIKSESFDKDLKDDLLTIFKCTSTIPSPDDIYF